MAADMSGKTITVGDRVKIGNGRMGSGKPGTVKAVSGNQVQLKLDDGRELTIEGDALVKTYTKPSTTMAQPGSLKVGDTVRENRQGAETGKVVDVRDNMITVRYRRQGGGAHDEDFHVTKLVKMSTMDITEVEVSPDGAVEVCVDPEGDEAAAGLMTYARQASCPYCRKTVAMQAGQLGDHRSPTGVCPGSRRGVARVEMGRAVLMAAMGGVEDQNGASVEPGDHVKVVGGMYSGREGVVVNVDATHDEVQVKLASGVVWTKANTTIVI